MNTTGIRELIEKYFEGNTTLDEESLLKDFFRQGKVPPDLAIYADLFIYYSDSAKDEISDPDFEQNFLAEINENRDFSIPVKSRRLYYITGLAATFIILCGLFFTFRYDILKNPGHQRLKDTYSNPEQAYTAAKKALLMVSLNMNTGLDQVQKFNSFQEGIDKVQTFSQFYRFQQIIINPDELNKRPLNP
jgi:hypothetical protein